jgi:hypothetical protein
LILFVAQDIIFGVIILSLRTAFNSEQYKNDDSPTPNNDLRISQYIEGLLALKLLVPEFDSVEKFVIDNTVKDLSQVPEIYKTLSNAMLFLTKTNKFGRRNKGAGDIETYQFLYKSPSVIFDYLLHFEPRLKLMNPLPLTELLRYPKDQFYKTPHSSSIISGCFMLSYSLHKAFIDNVDIKLMVRNRLSIEDLLADFAISNGIEIKNVASFCKRTDQMGNLIDY